MKKKGEEEEKGDKPPLNLVVGFATGLWYQVEPSLGTKEGLWYRIFYTVMKIETSLGFFEPVGKPVL